MDVEGTHLGPMDLAAELVNLGRVEADSERDIKDQFIHTLAIKASARIKFLEPYLAFTTPLDDGLRGEVFVITLGLGVCL